MNNQRSSEKDRERVRKRRYKSTEKYREVERVGQLDKGEEMIPKNAAKQTRERKNVIKRRRNTRQID